MTSSSAQEGERPPGSFVGREGELAELRAALDNANAGRGRPFMLSGEPIHWYGRAITSVAEGPNGDSNQLVTEIHLPRHLTLSACQVRRQSFARADAAKEPYPTFCLPASVAGWQRLAGILVFFADSAVLRRNEAICGATGRVAWIRLKENTNSDRTAARPALLVQCMSGSCATDRIEIVPHFAAEDPLLKHIVLVLQAELEANGADSLLYAQALADALAVHFLRRYAASRQAIPTPAGGMPPFKLRRVIAYVHEHLDQDLSLTRLAAAAQTSVAHFARLFKQTTGSTPHRYVLLCRIERAKRLLSETDLPLSEIAQRAGLADQSHLTALFRAYLAETPKAYRDFTKN